MEFQFGPWLPDQRDFRNPGLEDAENVIPGQNRYTPARASVDLGSTIPGTIIGSTAAILNDASTVYFVATTTDLYVIRNGVVTASGLTLTLTASETVHFERFGLMMYATAKGEGTWSLADVGNSTTFAAAAGTPPSANAIGRIGDFLVMGDLIDIDASDSPYRVRWSAFNNPGADWVTDIGRQSGFIDLDSAYGRVTGISGGVFGLIFQERAITAFTPDGSATVFTRNTYERERGCIAPSSIANVGERVFYLSQDGFYETIGVTPTPISTGRNWEWFKRRVSNGNFQFVQAELDFRNRCVVWAYSTTSSRAPTEQLYFFYERGEWSYVRRPVDWLIEGGISARTLSNLDTEFGNLDNIPGSLDDISYDGDLRELQAFINGDLSSFTGATLRARWVSGDAQPTIGRRSFIDEVTPLVEADSVSVRIGIRNKMSEQPTESSFVQVGELGYAPTASDARYFRVTVEIPAGTEWDEAYGYQLSVTDSGAI